MVAKSYQKIGWTGEPFKENGKMYILLNNGKKARWYSAEEYKKLYFMLFAAMADAVEELEQENYGAAKQRLITAQQEAEEQYIAEE